MTGTSATKHEGGCACGAVRYRVTGDPVFQGVCHCRYCQLRSGSAFGIGVYFPDERVELLSGSLVDFHRTTESDRGLTTRFCPACGTTVLWSVELRAGLTAVAGGTFDPPTFWYPIGRELFRRGAAPFLGAIEAAEHFETSPTYAPVREEEPRLTPHDAGS